MIYFKHKPRWLRKFYGNCVWEINSPEKAVYLTFDDGPHPEETPFVLQQLKNANAKATFFCIGKNVNEHYNIYEQIVAAGHATGNHTYTHPDGWMTVQSKYLQDVAKAKNIINSNLFRPPYGHIKSSTVRSLQNEFGLKTVLWDVLSGDFDAATSGEQCFNNVIENSKEGSIIVFHDSAKAAGNLRYALPKILEYFTDKGFEFKSIKFS
ncbi:polysaccharide deacetylase family protein [soil metagenome]